VKTKLLGKKRIPLVILLSIFVFIIVPALFLSSKLAYEPMQGLLTILKHSVHFLSFLFLFFVIQRFTDSSIPAIVVSILAAVYYVFISLLIGYWLYWGSPPDYFFAADAVNEIIQQLLVLMNL